MNAKRTVYMNLEVNVSEVIEELCFEMRSEEIFEVIKMIVEEFDCVDLEYECYKYFKKLRKENKKNGC
jgi:hypothetical protein